MLFDMKPEIVSAYTGVISLLIALCAMLIAFKQVRVSKSESRLGVAKGIYKDYLALAFANPQFSAAAYPLDEPRMRSFSRNPDEFERYEFFVSYLLFAAEEILELTKNDDAWRATLRDQLRYHALYLDSLELAEHHYSSELLKIREEAIREYYEHQELLSMDKPSAHPETHYQ